ncbi:MAG: IscS subfamily cysteine desulfurase [Candidatus Omnitrophica bacterium]|nr:IscS subfamily cysteine desulfurase [Candidatus Omnitrophota bacterium]
MRLTTRSEYGLICLKYLCEHTDRVPISLGEITENEKLPKDYVEQIFLRLRRASIIQSHKGVRGGFALSRPASQISIKEVFEALEGNSIFEAFCREEMREKIVCEHYRECSIRPIWTRLSELINDFCSKITLDVLLKNEKAVITHLDYLSQHWAQQIQDENRPAKSETTVSNVRPKPIYMDYHATTPLDPRVLEVMLPCYTDVFGNAASTSHVFGWEAQKLVDKGREQIAHIVGASSKEVIITSGATESINTALKGVFEMYREKGNHIITQVTEHKAVLDACRYLERKGAEVTYLPVDEYGLIRISDLENAITEKTILISIMYANNEIGTIQPITKIGQIAKRREILFHVDGAQAVGKIPVNVEEMGIDLLSYTAHKMYGPKGVGALYVRKKNPRVRLSALMHGGGHEQGFRSGTLNVAGIVAFGKACEIAEQEMGSEGLRLSQLRDSLKEKLQKELDEVYLNGHATERLPGNLNLSFGYLEGEALLMGIGDTVAVSSGSACTSGSVETSHVLRALNSRPDLMVSAIRFGIGRFNTAEEVERVAERVIQVVRKLREMSPLYKAAKEGKK